ncbi:MAG: helix-turn-helix domain-containing protein [Proteobacteria bacterium]|nr:helix-turn-helix domain-containing protein [Pseudomonadota bacterium]MBU4355959.1 helix-turn-helix domain-containing protein [Pseudomonadota bacterium]MBU4447804.1 helix-turn-helix domain-containing protein [Pseudomonadota bacterium]MCG2772241.1 helix-turn-helix domain-containing protein [Desulfobacterales bacterium]
MAWRKRHRLTQKELANLLGVRNLAVYRWECGMRSISPYLHLALEALENRLTKEAEHKEEKDHGDLS